MSKSPTSWKKHHTAAAPRAWALEARLMFDAAAVSDVLDKVTQATDTHLQTLQARDTTAVRDTQLERSSVDTSALSIAPAPVGREVLFIDRTVADLDFLLGGVRPGVDVVLLDPGSDPWAQMSQALAARPGTTAVHLVSHGNSGEIILGDHAYGTADLQARSAELNGWRQSLAAGADILLYGCDIAASGRGTQLVDTLATLTGADVAASNDATGGTAAGGDWALEYAHGTVETGHFLLDATASGYASRLATVTLDGAAGWVPIMFGAGQDPQGDSQAGAADTDIIGDATHGSLYTAFSDGGTSSTADDYLYFRLRIDNPTSTSSFNGVAVVGMDVNGDGRVDLFMSVDGRNNGQAVRLLDPGTGLNNSPNTTTTSALPTGWLANNGVYAFNSSNYAVTAVSASTDPNFGPSSTGLAGGTASNLTGIGGTDAFVSWRVSVADLATVLAKPSPLDGRTGVYGPRGATGFAGFSKDTTVSYVSFTQTQTGPINGDLNGVGASYDKNASFASLGVFTTAMSPANPVAASTLLTITDNVAGTTGLGQPVTFTFTFSENVTGFDASDISVTSGTKGAFNTVDGKTYTLVVTPDAGLASGDIGVSVASGAATGARGLPTLAATGTQAIDTLAPAVTVGTPALALSGRPTLGGSTNLADGNLVTVTIDPDNNATTADSVIYQALVVGGVWSLDTSTAVPTSGSLPSMGLSANSKVTATATDAAGNSSSAVELSRPTVNPLSTNALAPTLTGTWTNLAGDALTVTVGGATYNVTPSGDSWSLNLASATPAAGTLSLVAGNTYTVTATVTRGGVPVSDTTSGELVITTTPVTLVDITGGATASGTSTRPVITGTASNTGGFVIVRLDPNNDGNLSDAVTYSVIPDGGGNWSLDTAVATPIAGTVPAGGYVGSVGLRATDSTGQVVDTQVLTITTPTVAIGSISSAASTNASAIVSNTAGTGASNLNMAEDANVTFSGTAAGATAVNLTITDINGHAVTVDNVSVTAGTWSATGVNLSGLDNGTLTVKATLSGTTVSATDSSVTHDKVAPFILDTTQSPIRATAGAIIKGSTDLTSGTVLTISIHTDAARTALAQTLTATVTADGSWSALTSANLGNNSTAYFTVTAPANSTDAAGNLVQPVQFSRSVQNSIGNSTRTIDVKPITGDNLVAVSEIGSGLVINGETSVTSATVTVVISQNGTTLFTKTASSGATYTAGTNNWTLTLTPAEAQQIANGQFLVSASVPDGSVTLSDAELPTLNLAAPTLTITDDIPGTATGAFLFTFTFTENVTGFTAGDIVLSAGATAGTFSTIDARTYTLAVTPPASGSGTVTATVASGTATGVTTGRSIVGTSATQDYAAPALAAAPTLTINVDALATSGTPVITGATTLAPGAPVVITIDPDNNTATANDVSYSATVQSDGRWSLDLASATPTSGSLPAGGLPTYAKVTATATNAYGNSTTVIGQDTPTVTAQTSTSHTPTVSGTWTSGLGDTLSVTVNGVSYTPTVSGNTWSVNVTSVLPDGTYQVVATTSRSGVDKVDVTTSELVIDTLATVDITGGATVLTNALRPVISGTATGMAAGTLLTLQLDTDNNGSYDLSYQTTVQADGSWSVNTATAVPSSGTLPASGLNGDTPMRASATDAAGNTGADTQTLQVDVTPPQIAFSSGTRTASSLPLIRGTTDLPAGSTLTVVVDAITYSGVVVQSDGSWSVQTTTAVSGTVNVSATSTDAAGNTATVAQPLTFDAVTPSIAVNTVTDVTNDLNSDGKIDATEDDSVTLAGTTANATVGDTVTVYITDGSLTLRYTTTVLAGGGWNLSGLNLSALASGPVSVTASLTDSGGTIYTDTTRFTHDKSATVAIDRISDDTGLLGDFTTTDTTVAIAGSATANAAVGVVVKDSGGGAVASFSVTADASGNWSTTATSALPQGSYTLEATVGGTTATKALTIVSTPLLASSTPADNATGIAVTDNLSLTFSKNVLAGSGYVVLYNGDGTLEESFNIATGLGDKGGSLSFNGSTGLTLNPFADLIQSTNYYLKIDAGAVLDANGNPYAGISTATTLNFTTAGSNSAPDNTVPAAQAVNEDSALAFSSANGNLISVDDVNGNLASTRLTVLNGGLTVSLGGGASLSAGSNGGRTLTLSGTQTQINLALATLSYQADLNYSGSDTLTVLSTDNAATPLSRSSTVAITVNAVNDAPVATTSGGSAAFIEGNNVTSTPVVVDAGLTVSDVDNTTLASATVSITGNLQSAEDQLAFINNPATMGNIAASYSSATGVLSLTSAGATATLAQWQAALRSVTYTNSSDTPNTATRTVSFDVNDGSTTSAAAARTITVTPVNDTPIATASAGTASFVENASGSPTPVAVDPGLTLSDLDNTTLASATVAITGNFQSTQDVLAFSNTSVITFGNVTASYDSSTGVLTLTSAGATASVAQWQAALQAVSYSNSASDPGNASRTVSFVVNDGTANSSAATRQVTVTPSNNAPVLATGSTLAYTENQAASAVDANLTLSDVDSATLGGATVSLSGGFASGQDVLGFTAQNGISGNWNAATGTLTLSGSATVAQYQAALRSVTYANSSDAPSTATRTVSFQVDDGAAANNLSNVLTSTITVAAVNDAPTVANGLAPRQAVKNTAFTLTVPASTFADVDTGDTLTYTATLADGSPLPTWLSFNPATGVFLGTPGEANVGALTLRVIATDRAGASAFSDLALTVAASNAAPTLAVPIADQVGTQDQPFSFTVPGGTFADADAGDIPALAATLANGDPLPAWLHFDAGTGRFTGKPANGDVGAIDIRVTATDGGGLAVSDVFRLTVTDVNDAPTAANASVTTAEDTALSGSLPAYMDIDGDAVTYALGMNASHGTVVVSADGRYTYTPAANDNGADAFTYTVSDGNGGRSTYSVAVTVSAVNDAPIWADNAAARAAATTAQDTPVMGSVPAASDAEGDALTYAKGSDPAHGAVTVDASGRYIYTPAAGFHGTDSFTVRIDDSHGGLRLLTVQVAVLAAPAVPAAPIVAPEPAPAPIVAPIAAPVAAPIVTPSPAPATTPVADFDSALGTALRSTSVASDAGDRTITPPQPAATPVAAPTVTTLRATTDGDIYTRPSGFQIMVTPSAEPSLKLFRGVDDQIVPLNRTLVVQVPADAFVHTVLTETVTLSATRADGTPLPGWLSFDGKSGKLVGQPPVNQAEDLAIRITARDSQGREVTTMFRIKVADGKGANPTSRTSFSEQLARGEALAIKPGQRAWQALPRPVVARRA